MGKMVPLAETGKRRRIWVDAATRFAWTARKVGEGCRRFDHFRFALVFVSNRLQATPWRQREEGAMTFFPGILVRLGGVFGTHHNPLT